MKAAKPQSDAPEEEEIQRHYLDDWAIGKQGFISETQGGRGVILVEAFYDECKQLGRVFDTPENFERAYQEFCQRPL